MIGIVAWVEVAEAAKFDVGSIEVYGTPNAGKPGIVELISPPGIPDLDRDAFSDTAWPLYEAWKRHEPAPGLAELLADSRAPEAHALLGYLRGEEAASAWMTANDAYYVCGGAAIERGEDPTAACGPVPMIDLTAALDQWRQVDAGQPALVAWVRDMEANAWGSSVASVYDPVRSIAAFRAVMAMPGASPDVRADAGWNLAGLLDPHDPDAVTAIDVAIAGPDVYRGPAWRLKASLVVHQGRDVEAIRAALDAIAAGVEDVGAELSWSAARAAYALGPAGTAFVEAADGPVNDRAVILVLAAKLALDNGDLSWARADVSAAERLNGAVAADPFVVGLGSTTVGPERPDQWIRRAISRCMAVTPEQIGGGSFDLELTTTKFGDATAKFSGATGDATALSACFAAPQPPPEGPIVGRVRAHAVIKPPS
jgi:hypothetical protein